MIFCLLFKFIQCITRYFLSAYNDNPKHANAVHSTSIYTPTPSKHPLTYRFSTNVTKNEPISMPTQLYQAKKELEYSIFLRISKQFIVIPHFMAIMTNKCPNISMKTHRSRLCFSLCVFVPMCTWNTEYNIHVASDLILKPVWKNDKS